MIETFAAEGFPLTFFPSQVVRQMRKIPSCPISGSLGRLTFTFLQGLRCVCMCVCVYDVCLCVICVYVLVTQPRQQKQHRAQSLVLAVTQKLMSRKEQLDLPQAVNIS